MKLSRFLLLGTSLVTLGWPAHAQVSDGGSSFSLPDISADVDSGPNDVATLFSAGPFGPPRTLTFQGLPSDQPVPISFFLGENYVDMSQADEARDTSFFVADINGHQETHLDGDQFWLGQVVMDPAPAEGNLPYASPQVKTVIPTNPLPMFGPRIGDSSQLEIIIQPTPGGRNQAAYAIETLVTGAYDNYTDAGDGGDWIIDDGIAPMPDQRALDTALHAIEGILEHDPRILPRALPDVLQSFEIQIRRSNQGMTAYPTTVAALFAAASKSIVAGDFDETEMEAMHVILGSALHMSLMRHAARLPPDLMAGALIDIARSLTGFAADNLTRSSPILGSLLREIAAAVPLGQRVEDVLSIRRIAEAVTVGDFETLDAGRLQGPVSASRT